MEEVTREKIKLKPIEKSFIVLGVAVFVTILAMITGILVIEVTPYSLIAMGLLMIFILISYFIFGRYIIDVQSNSNLADLQANVAITQATIMTSDEKGGTSNIGFRMTDEDSTDDDTEEKLRKKVRGKNLFTKRY